MMTILADIIMSAFMIRANVRPAMAQFKVLEKKAQYKMGIRIKETTSQCMIQND